MSRAVRFRVMRFVRHERPRAILLAVTALVLIVLGVVYATVLPSHLPSFLPGHVDYRTTKHYDKRAALCFVGAVALGSLAWYTSRARRRWLRHR
jgi:hypothetical protein